VLFAVVSPPSAFGELAVIDGGPRTASATARGRTELLRVTRATVLGLLDEHPSVGAAMLTSLAALVRRLDDHASGLSLHRLPRRVRRYLLTAALDQHTASSANAGVGPTLPLELRISQTDLARQVGGSRQQVNRILAALEATGAIERTGSRIVAVRPELLEDEND
jgi:CRP-like cAMP-binding protein